MGELSVMHEEDLDTLLADCARMVPHWVTPPEAHEESARVSAAAIRGVRVPAGSARMLEVMPEYAPECGED